MQPYKFLKRGPGENLPGLHSPGIQEQPGWFSPPEFLILPEYRRKGYVHFELPFELHSGKLAVLLRQNCWVLGEQDICQKGFISFFGDYTQQGGGRFFFMKIGVR